MTRKGTQYYAERLLSQAICDPSVNALDEDAVRDYIEQEADKLCLPAHEVANYAMIGYRSIQASDFKRNTYTDTSLIYDEQ